MKKKRNKRLDINTQVYNVETSTLNKNLCKQRQNTIIYIRRTTKSCDLQTLTPVYDQPVPVHKTALPGVRI